LATRDGVYDYNYLYLANALGLGDEVDALVDDLVEWDAEEEEWTWDDDSDAFDTARETLGAMIASRAAVYTPIQHVGSAPAAIGRASSSDTALGRTESALAPLGR